MLNRWIGILSVFAMLSANVALVLKDVAPTWMVGDPPANDAALLHFGEKRHSQLGIFNADGHRVGQSWTISSLSGPMLHVQSWTLIEQIRLPNDMFTPRVRVYTSLSFQQGGLLDSLKLDVNGLRIPVTLSGEHVPPDDFPCQWHFGLQSGTFVLPADATRALGDVIRPFDRLPGLFVGRTWRMNLLDPLAKLLPGWASGEFAPDSQLVRVTAQETLLHNGEQVEVFRVESNRATALVALDGCVLVQEVDAPLFGRLRLVDEPFQEGEWQYARDLVFDREPD